MSIGSRIKEARKAKKLSLRALADQIGGHASTISDWEKDKYDPPLGKVIQLAQVLDVDPNFLSEDENNFLDIFSDEERAFIWKIRDLDDWEKELIFDVTDRLAEAHYQRQKVLEEEIEDIPEFPHIDIPSFLLDLPSAGTGNQISDFTDAEIRSYKATPEAKKADFAIKISGHSMEPVYNDGDIVLVKSQPVVENGDIGIFFMDGETYIKQLRNNYLHSMNPDYSDIEITGEVHCFGKVLGKAEI